MGWREWAWLTVILIALVVCWTAILYQPVMWAFEVIVK